MPARSGFTLEKIHSFRSQLSNLIHFVDEVIEQSEVLIRIE